jgi:pseudouridine synthase
VSRVRLNRYLALCGVASRRKSELIIGEGRVRVNGEVVTTPARIIDPRADRVELDGQPVKPAGTRGYYILNKPAGFLTTLSDPRGRRTIAVLMPRAAGRLYPAGRLDSGTTGLILLTDDGELAFRVMHPRHHLPKRYLALVSGVVSEASLARLREGVDLEGRPARMLAARRVASDGVESVLVVELGEGRKHQVRRMCEAIGHAVRRLHRESIGPIPLGSLAEGESRPLTIFEVRTLRRAVGLGDF